MASKKQTTESVADVSLPLPEAGGSYTRDPQTGELTLQSCTKAIADEDDDAVNDNIEFSE